MRISPLNTYQYNAKLAAFRGKKPSAAADSAVTSPISDNRTKTSNDVPFVEPRLFSKAQVNKFINPYNYEIKKTAQKIIDLDSKYSALSNEELQHKTVEFKEILANRPKSDDPMEDLRLEKEALDAILPDAYATVREAAKRTLNKKHYRVQLEGGIILHNGDIAEMNTGEGKTLVATLPAYLNALTGKGVHVVTVNDYLAQRDAELNGKLFNFLGLSVGVITSTNGDAESKRRAYNCDITYGINSEFGFDYLRDNMVQNIEDRVQRPYSFAIVDEADSILIDEARTPLIISGGADRPEKMCKAMAETAAVLEPEVDYEVDEQQKSIILTPEGEEKAEEKLGICDLYSEDGQYAFRLTQALKAKEFFKRDSDYIVQNGEAIIVDKGTGRLMNGRRWSDGLHQAVEAKEGLDVHSEVRSIASVTYQNLYRLYPRLSGMTGTGMNEREEFRNTYNLDVIHLEPNAGQNRQDLKLQVYKTEKAKFEAVADEIERVHKTGRPILVGTTSVDKSEHLSELLKSRGIEHKVLNAKYAKEEADIIAQAGSRGAVTIATNMAGRGTDILIGGNSEFLAKEFLAKRGIYPNNPSYDIMLDTVSDKIKKDIIKDEHDALNQLGGLHVIGTEMHESSRIDDQLKGRAGRQGDNGTSQFFVSLEDELIRVYGGDDIEEIYENPSIGSGPIDDDNLRKKIKHCQKKVESNHYAARKHVLEYDDVLNKQRKIFYEDRLKMLGIGDLRENIERIIEKDIDRIVEEILPSAVRSDKYTDEDFAGLVEAIQVEIPVLEYLKAEDLRGLSREDISSKIKELALKEYKNHETKLVQQYNAYAHRCSPDIPAEEPFSSDNIMRNLEKSLFLRIADDNWTEHLYQIEGLRRGIGLVGYAGKDPLKEYQTEAFRTFTRRMETIQSEMVQRLFRTDFDTLIGA